MFARRGAVLLFASLLVLSAGCMILAGLEDRTLRTDPGAPDAEDLRDATGGADASPDACEPRIACGECGRGCLGGRACDGGKCEPVSVVEQSGETPLGIAQSGILVYLAYTTEIRGCNKSGCINPFLVATDPGARFAITGIAADDSSVYYSAKTGVSAGAVYSCPVGFLCIDLAAATQRTRTSLNASSPTPTPGGVEVFAALGVQVATVNEGWVLQCKSPGNCNEYRGGTVAPTQIAFSPDRIFWAGGGAVFATGAVDDGGLIDGVLYAQNDSRAIAHAGGFVYYGERTIQRCPATELPCEHAETLTPDLGVVRKLVADGSYVYALVASSGASDGKIVRLEPTSKTTLTLVDGLYVAQDFVLDATTAYVLELLDADAGVQTHRVFSLLK